MHPDDMLQPFDADRFAALSTARLFGRVPHVVDSVPSTNDLLRQLADGGAPHGALVVADHQSAGKGRMGRTWIAPPRTSLLSSLLLRPTWPASRLSRLTMIAGVAALEAIAAVTGKTFALKWPNDLVAVGEHDRLRKLGGILQEAQLVGDGARLVILGIGINVNMTSDQLPEGVTPPTSILIETGAPVEREALLAALMERLEAWYGRVDLGESPHEAWNSYLALLGKEVKVSGAGVEIGGVVTGCDQLGRLLVRDHDGTLHTISAGDVTLRG